ncbi:MAG: FtsW/RodA/SpoVE family cell cycle protein [Bacilli bacterium]|jgi:cell division protein FtsW|nr:FtsW/RodA/SpoVE family cell cycle protein [Bacilli bacterium]
MKNLISKMDKPLLILTIIYAVLGLVMILSASSVSAVLRYNVPSSYFFIRQSVFVGVSFLVGFLFVLRFPTSKYKYVTPLLVFGILVSLIGLFIYGKITNGAQSWYRVGFFNLQPAEFAKSVIIIYMAVFYNKSLKKKKSLYYNLIPVAIAILFFVLIAMQPDLGGAIIIAGISFFLFNIVPIDSKGKAKLMKVGAIGVVLIGILLLYSGTEFLNAMQMSRLEFKNPCSRYSENTGYQVCNGFIAIHNGGLFGLGLGNSTQKYLYLPEAHTDFIFPILVEELGLIVGGLVLIGYGVILYRILKIAKMADNPRGAILAFGTFLMLLFHLLVNFMGILALIPLTGVPVPFLSYGGSYTINVFIMIFVVQRVAIETKNNQAKREIAEISKK